MFLRGEVVKSEAGRDRGVLLAVTECSDGYVYVCDGKARRLEKPKRKNPKHISHTAERLNEDLMRSNSALRKALAFSAARIGKTEV